MNITKLALVACIPLFFNACDSGDSSSDASENVPESATNIENQSSSSEDSFSQCPSENVQVGDTCQYASYDGCMTLSGGRHSCTNIYNIVAVYTADGGWVVRTVNGVSVDSTSEIDVSESSDESLSDSSCTLDRENTCDSVWVGANEKYGYYEYYECAAGKWKPVSLTYVICKNDSNAVGDTCVYERYEGVSKYCNTYIYSYKGNDEWEGVDTLSCWNYQMGITANEKCSLDTLAVGDTCSFDIDFGLGTETHSCVYSGDGRWENCL